MSDLPLYNQFEADLTRVLAWWLGTIRVTPPSVAYRLCGEDPRPMASWS